jgi:hypothetical protein
VVQPALEGAHCVLGLHELCFDLIAYFKIEDYILLIRWEELRRGLICTTSAEALLMNMKVHMPTSSSNWDDPQSQDVILGINADGVGGQG